MNLTERARRLILAHEAVGQPWKWPGGDSGITIGYGYDLGYTTSTRFREDWRDELSAPSFDRLQKAIGRRGEAAERIADEFRGIGISADAALNVFERRTVPQTFIECHTAFPGFDALPPDAQGALVSLVFNRGASMGIRGRPSWERRKEMRAIRVAVESGDLAEIAKQLRLMKRLWIGVKLDGLIRRREDEAELVESAIGERA